MSVTPLLFAAVVLKWDSDVFLTLGSNYRHLNLYIYLSINEIEKSFSFSFCCVQHLHDRNYVGLSLVLTFPFSGKSCFFSIFLNVSFVSSKSYIIKIITSS